MPAIPTPDEVSEKILSATQDRVSDQQKATSRLAAIAELSAQLKRLSTFIAPFLGAAIAKTIDNQNDIVSAVLSLKQPVTDLAPMLADLYGLQTDLQTQMATLVGANKATPDDDTAVGNLMADIVARTRNLLSARPDVLAVMADLAALKDLKGGPADAIAYHDFYVLQLATKSVWLHSFDASLKSNIEQLYQKVVEASSQSSVAWPPLDAVEDVSQLRELLIGLGASISAAGGQPIPSDVSAAFPGSESAWAMLSPDQQSALIACVANMNDPNIPPDVVKQYRALGQGYLDNPTGPVGRLSQLMLEIGKALNEPYAFDVYAPNTHNYGLLITYRQKWEPLEYQAGQLVSTIPLAPMETRKFTKKRVIKTTVARKVAEKSSSLRSLQSSETSRAEAEIMERATTSTNFKMTSSGSFNIGIGSMSVTNEFGGSSESFSSASKKAFHEATLKAAEEYRQERSVEVDTSSSVETEETTSGEISNPNNEITVTYLFYELQRRFRVHEFVYRAQPVILVAQDVPEPHEIDEGWLVQYQWILARVLLDESFRPALNYLTSGFAGDEVSIEVLRASWEKQKTIVDNLEALAESQLASRNALRELIVNQTLQKEELDNSMHGLGLLTNLQDSLKSGDWTFSNLSKTDASAEDIEANRRAAETRLKYMEESLKDAQEKLVAATNAFEAATKSYTEAMQNKYSRHVAIDQLRVHVKQNILYYMQAIWAHEVPDQRYFRLHKLPVPCPAPTPSFVARFVGSYLKNPSLMGVNFTATGSADDGVDHDHDLGIVADLDNPLGYKGNYIIFPLLTSCPLTDYMLTDYIDGYLGLKDPDTQAPANFDPEEFDQRWQDAANDLGKRDALKGELTAYLKAFEHSVDEIIVPTGELFIEALPGSHALLEDFKLLHRMEDVIKVQTEVSHAELENLRLAARLVGGMGDSKLLEDPNIEKKIIVEGNSAVLAGG